MLAYLSLRVQLLEAKPPIWRTFLLTKDATFQDLHTAIQDACGWSGVHLFAFYRTARGPVIATALHEDDSDGPAPEAGKVPLTRYLKREKDSCFYQYDFGDDWWHKVTLTEVAKLDERFSRRLVGGARAFPPEDCGGVTGYEECVALLEGKTTGRSAAEAKELRKWLGGWHPERFDPEAVKRRFDR